MASLTKKLSKKAGLAPGTLVHVGSKKVEKLKITLLQYNETTITEKDDVTVQECLAHRGDTRQVLWLNVEGVHDADMIQQLGEGFGIHRLVLEDVMNTRQRPKLEDFETYLFLVSRLLSISEESNRLISEQVSFVLGSGYLISFQEKSEDMFHPVRQRIREGKGRIRKQGVDYLAYSLIDAVVDHYFSILEDQGEKVEMLEETLLSGGNGTTLPSIHQMKQDMILLRRSVWPLREVLSVMQHTESSLIRPEMSLYLRDVYDHTVHAIEIIESLRELLSSLVDIHLSTMSHRMNAVMQVLTVVSTIFIPLTFIVGVYGMNFKYMPELEWFWGYPSVLLLMTGITLGMVIFFKRKRWM